jgi:hypothetical protein
VFFLQRTYIRGGLRSLVHTHAGRTQVTGKPFKKSWLPLVQYVMMLIRTFTTAMSIKYVHDQYWKNTIIINTVRLSPVDVNMSIQEKKILYKVGYKTAIEFILKGLSWACTAITKLKLNATEPKV